MFFLKHPAFYLVLITIGAAIGLAIRPQKTIYDSTSDRKKYDYVKSLAAVQSGELNPAMETITLVKIKEGLHSGETSYNALNIDKLDIEVLTAKNLIRTKKDCVEKMRTLDPNSEPYKAYKFVVDSINKDHPHLVDPDSYK